MTVSTYRNPWNTGPRLFETEARPTRCNGYLIYGRIRGVCYDVVKDGVCVAQRGSRRAAAAWALEQPSPYSLQIPLDSAKDGAYSDPRTEVIQETTR